MHAAVSTQATSLALTEMLLLGVLYRCAALALTISLFHSPCSSASCELLLSLVAEPHQLVFLKQLDDTEAAVVGAGILLRSRAVYLVGGHCNILLLNGGLTGTGDQP